MILKHFLILVIANCCVDAADNGLDNKQLSALPFNGSEVLYNDFNSIQSYTNLYSTHNYTNPLLFKYSHLSEDTTLLDGDFVFQISCKMCKGEYVKHVLRDIDDRNN